MIGATAGLIFDPETHTYWHAGAVLPSVTQVLTAQHVTADLSGVPEPVLTFARDRGRAIHLAVRFANEGRLDTSSLAELEPYVFAWEAFCAAHAGDFLPEVVEVPLADVVRGFAGTPDAAGLFRNRRAVVDVKSGAYDAAWGVQLAAYKHLLRVNGYPVLHRLVVQLCPNGDFKLHPFTDPLDHAEWDSALLLYTRRMNRQNRTTTR